MTTIIGAPSNKGGVGKSTTIVNLAAACARAGLHTIVIDADMQGNASQMMDVQKADNFYDLIVGGKDWEDVLVPVPTAFTNMKTHELYVVPSALATSILKKHELTARNMVDLIGLLRNWADVVLIDTGPGFDDIHTGMYSVADYIVLPTQCELDSIESLADTFTLLEATAAQFGHTAKTLGILPTMFDSGINAHLMGHDMLKAMYRRTYALFDPVLALAAFKDARGRSMSIYAHLENINQRGLGRRMNKQSAGRAVKTFDVAIADRVIAMARTEVAVA